MKIPQLTKRLTPSYVTWKDVLHIGLDLGSTEVDYDTNATPVIVGGIAAIDATGIALGGQAVALALSSQILPLASASQSFAQGELAALQLAGPYSAPLQVDVVGTPDITFSPYTYIAKRDAGAVDSWTLTADWADGVSGKAEIEAIFHLPAEEGWRGALQSDANYTTSGNRVTAVKAGKLVTMLYEGGLQWAPSTVTQYLGRTMSASPFVDYLAPAMTYVGEGAATAGGDSIVGAAAVTAILEYLEKTAKTAMRVEEETRQLYRDSTILEMWPGIPANQAPPSRAGRRWRVDVVRTTTYQPVGMDRWDYHGFVGRGFEWDNHDTSAASSVPVFVGGDLEVPPR